MTERQKELIKAFEALCYGHSPHEVWRDMVEMSACAIANTVDKQHFDEREARYMSDAQKYTRDQMRAFASLFDGIVQGMEEEPDCDFLGELYMLLELGNGRAGQFFTPYNISRMMAEMIDVGRVGKELEANGWTSINDCACGAGAMLVAAANALRRRGINYQTQVLFVGQDLDATAAMMCYIQLSLRGCAGYVKIGDTLQAPMTGDTLIGDGLESTWYTPMYFNEVWAQRRLARIVFGSGAGKTVQAAVTEKAPERPEKKRPKKAATAAEQIMFDL